MTTHDFALLSRYADQVVLVDRTILCQGSARDVFASESFCSIFHTKGADAQ